MAFDLVRELERIEFAAAQQAEGQREFGHGASQADTAYRQFSFIQAAGSLNVLQEGQGMAGAGIIGITQLDG
ncbi:hypothetical protein [Sporomusa termitida]|nr:hypothetical protein [Sporomusa termitida]